MMLTFCNVRVFYLCSCWDKRVELKKQKEDERKSAGLVCIERE
jgi:hypothetical protein